MAGTLTATTIQNDTSSPPTFRNNSVEIGRLCRAWVNFNGTNASIRASFNVSSVTRNSTGDYTVTMTNALEDANYAFVGTAGGGSVNPNGYFTGPSTATTITSSVYRFQTRNDSASLTDEVNIMTAVFR